MGLYMTLRERRQKEEPLPLLESKVMTLQKKQYLNRLWRRRQRESFSVWRQDVEEGSRAIARAKALA